MCPLSSQPGRCTCTVKLYSTPESVLLPLSIVIVLTGAVGLTPPVNAVTVGFSKLQNLLVVAVAPYGPVKSQLFHLQYC